MCGIAGVVNLNCNDMIKSSMLKTMHARGPDSSGIWECAELTLLHSRLAVIDPENGKQPMTLERMGYEYIIVYNGELYNTQEIKKELMALGHTFRDSSDTEVVLHAYAQWQEACLSKFNGIYAFAVWDIVRKELFLARDRIGVKPLFYKHHEEGFLFASEMKTILQYPTVYAEIDSIGVAQIMMLGPGRMPGSGVFRNIYELEPGCYGKYKNGRWAVERYWKLTDAEHMDSFEHTADYVRFLVTDAIKRQTVSDVPVGTFLSGGLDSSLISAICAQDIAQKQGGLCTFSVDYENNQQHFVAGQFQPDSDNAYIDIMQKALGTQHHWTVLNSRQLADALCDAVRARDLPGMADVDSSLLLFCKDVRRYVKVALSGECADEIFGGYPWYRDPKVRSVEGFPWAQNTKFRAQLINKDRISEKDAMEFVGDLYSQTVMQTDILPQTDPVNRRMKQMVNLNLRWFMQTLLDRKDRMSMYHGLEVRVPFCDHRIVEYLYTVPWEYKDYRNREKGLLRYAMRDILPQEILWRKKSPYPKTFDPGYSDIVSGLLKDILADKNSPVHGIIDKNKLKEIFSNEPTWPWYGQLMKTPQTMAFVYMLNFWLKEYKVKII